MQGLAGEAGAVGTTGARVSTFAFLFAILFYLIQPTIFTFITEITSESSQYILSCAPYCHFRENEVLQEREVKLDPMGYRDPKVLLVDQDPMDQRYNNSKTSLLRLWGWHKKFCLFYWQHMIQIYILNYFRVTLVQRVLVENQEVQDFKVCRGKEVYQDLQAQKEML